MGNSFQENDMWTISDCMHIPTYSLRYLNLYYLQYNHWSIHWSADFQKFGEPNIRDLCEYVATEIAGKWEEFGISVGVKQGDLRAIRAGRPREKTGFIQVFDKWHNGMTSPYTWEKVAEALESLHEKWLLKELYRKLAETGTFWKTYRCIMVLQYEHIPLAWVTL